MADKLALLIWNIKLEEHPEYCVTPMIHALAAKALDAEVELHFAGPAIRLLVPGVADQLYTTPKQEKSLGDYLRELIAAKVSLYGCSMATANWIAADETLISECRHAGATAFIVRALDPEWQVLTY